MSRSDFIVCSTVLVTATMCFLCYSSEGAVTDATAFPWFCLVVHQNSLVSTCTIIRDTWVVVSVDNLNQQIPGSAQYYYQVIGELVITAGEEASKNANPDFYQVRSPTKLYGGLVTRDNSEITQIFENPDDLGGVIRDLYGIALNVGLLRFDDPFKWSEYVKPVPLFDSLAAEANKKPTINAFLDQTELELTDQTPCVVASWKPSTHSMEKYEVAFVPEQSCKESYCAYSQDACRNFPHRLYHMCFKSLSFRDMCPKDRGAALFCYHFNERVIGILTTAVNCGFKNLPCVYTSAEIVQKLLNKAMTFAGG